MNYDPQTTLCFNSIFQQPWWLDAVAPGGWGSAEVVNNDRIAARLPYALKKRRGLTLLTMPPLTQTLGPCLAPADGKYAKRLSRQMSLLDSLIDRLPPCDYFDQNFHYSITNWLPFYWRGFTQTTRYTYVLEQLQDPDLLWSEIQSNIRNKIRNAQKQLVVRHDLEIESFLDITSLTFERQGRSLPYGREAVRRLDKACAEHGARRIFFAEDARGRVHAALYLVWDENSAYNLMSGTDPRIRQSGAMSLLVWEAIRFAATVTKKFDFEGTMLKPVEIFFRDFGARQVPYFRVIRASRRMKLLLAGRDFLAGLGFSSR